MVGKHTIGPMPPTVNGMVGIPTVDNGRWSVFYEFLLGLQKPDRCAVMQVRGSSVAENRNEVIRKGLDLKTPWILFLDDDMVFEPDLLVKLLKHNKAIVSAHYLKRSAPYESLAFAETNELGGALQDFLGVQHKGLCKVSAAGAGALLVRREVFEAMESPWFTLGQLDKEKWGDDLHFFHKAKQAGFEAFVDYDVNVGHITAIIVVPRRGPDGTWTTVLRSVDTEITVPAATKFGLAPDSSQIVHPPSGIVI